MRQLLAVQSVLLKCGRNQAATKPRMSRKGSCVVGSLLASLAMVIVTSFPPIKVQSVLEADLPSSVNTGETLTSSTMHG